MISFKKKKNRKYIISVSCELAKPLSLLLCLSQIFLRKEEPCSESKGRKQILSPLTTMWSRAAEVHVIVFIGWQESGLVVVYDFLS